MSDPLFRTVDARRTFRSRSGTTLAALDGVSVDIERGGFWAVTGPSGCGKTTLLSLLAALDRPSAGAVFFDGTDAGGASEWQRARIRRRVGIVFQQTPMIARLPLWENVTLPLVPRGMRSTERRRWGAELLERVGVGGREAARPEELSGGERQRVGIARALATKPEALVADEPTSDLDSDSAAAIVDLFGELHAAGATIVVATHDPRMQGLATAQCSLRAGRVLDKP